MAGPSGLVSGARQRTAARLSLALHVSIALVALSIAFVLFDNSLFAW
jgi:cytochrome b-561 domain-containing protein 2